ncbi:MAG: histidine kinase [Bacteroidota bacterium]|nr:histidine kinase [Bacteroidota bacterium]
MQIIFTFVKKILNSLMLKKIFLLKLCFCCFLGLPQDKKTDSLKKVLSFKISDTLKLQTLNSLINELPDGEWEKYNMEMKVSSEKMLQKALTDKTVKQVILKYYSIAIQNEAIDFVNNNKSSLSIPLFKKCILIYTEINMQNETAWSYLGIAKAYIENGKLNLAIDCLYKGLLLFEKTNDYEGVNEVYMSLGSIYFTQNEYRESIDMYNKAYIYAKKIEYIDGMYEALFRTARCYLSLKNFEISISYFQKSNLVLDSLRKEKYAIDISNNIAYVYIAKKDFTKAINQFKVSFEIAKNRNDTIRMATSNMLISETYAVLKKYDSAILYGENSLDLLNKSKDKVEIVRISKNLYLDYKAIKSYKKALEMYELNRATSEDLLNKEIHEKILKSELKFMFDKKELLLKTENEKLINKMKQDSETENIRKNNMMIILASLFIVLFVGLFSLYKVQKQKAIIALQNSDLFRQKMLLSQMNPHFIFNSINSIQNYVLNKHEDAAYNYLAKFGKLIRMVLNNSREDDITLDIEIETLALYVELEQLRFDNKFSYELNISDELNEFDIKIPAMLIQPYVENAILHGLMNLEEERNGKLTIKIQNKNNLLLVSIEDNGIGRVRSNQFKNESLHDPLAMKLTEERIEMINKLENTKNIKISILDLYDAQQKAIGTRVELFLPLIS